MVNGWIVKHKGGNLDYYFLVGCAIIGKVYFLKPERKFNATAQRREDAGTKKQKQGSEGVGKRESMNRYTPIVNIQ